MLSYVIKHKRHEREYLYKVEKDENGNVIQFWSTSCLYQARKWKTKKGIEKYISQFPEEARETMEIGTVSIDSNGIPYEI